MITKKRSIADSRLYVILGLEDAERLSMPIESLARLAGRGGADMVQLRDKRASTRAVADAARDISRASTEEGFIFIVNDYIAIAAQSGADGVHLGQDDAPVAEARKALSPKALVGKSTHSVAQALAAQTEGADYIGFGPIFGTPTKPDYKPIGLENIAEVARRIKLPFFAIGGIDKTNIAQVRNRGASRVAVVRAAVATRDIASSVLTLKQELLAS